MELASADLEEKPSIGFNVNQIVFGLLEPWRNKLLESRIETIRCWENRVVVDLARAILIDFRDKNCSTVLTTAINESASRRSIYGLISYSNCSELQPLRT